MFPLWKNQSGHKRARRFYRSTRFRVEATRLILVCLLTFSERIAVAQTSESTPVLTPSITPLPATGEVPAAVATPSEANQAPEETPKMKAAPEQVAGSPTPSSHVSATATILVEAAIPHPSSTSSPQTDVPKDANLGVRDGSAANRSTQNVERIKYLGTVIADFHRKSAVVVFLLVDALVLCFAIGFVSFAAAKLGSYLWYPAVLVIVFCWTWLQNETDYFAVFALGMATAFAEIIGKFRDEPLESVRTSYAILYHIFNGVIAMAALCVLDSITTPSAESGDHVKKILVAGLGAMLIMRSKFFNIKIGGEDVSFGPEQIVKIFLNYMEGAIDRIRAEERLNLINRQLDMLQVDRFNDFANHIITMMGSAQTRTMEQNAEFEEKLRQICDDPDESIGARNKCIAMSFQLLNAMGEEFAMAVFRSAPPEIRNVAPPSIGPSVLKRIVVAASPFTSLPADDFQHFMAYGAGMSGTRLRERLKWSEEQYRKIPSIKRCQLPKYRLVFNKRDSAGTGRANVVPDEAEKVEGVLYTLTKDQMHFLDTQLPDCQRRTMRVKTDGGPVDAEVYFALNTGESLRPNAMAINDMITGAEEHKLPRAYVERLRGLVNEGSS